MLTYFAIIPGFPLMSFILLALFGDKLSNKAAASIGAGLTAISAVLTVIAGIELITSDLPVGGAWNVTLWHWINTGGFSADISFRLDALSLIFCFVITFVGFLILVYSIEFMSNDEGFRRFFAYMNLFIGSMLILVLADNLLLLYLGWEGVGLCSYLLIGFWYKEPANDAAARKAFIITRIGDTAMILGLFLLFLSFGTLNINDLMQQASTKWVVGSPLAVISALLLLGGAIGKSAQFPLQTWLPDAMAGPSPVSALIHAATMVTAGVYLIARTHVLFALAPIVQTLVAVIGAITLLIAGFSALTQHDLKRVLAYSTISQIGYMFVALGVGAWQASIFHFMIHAFFKALLFLSGGVVILLLHEEHDIFKMGGLRKLMPAVFITFLIGSASLSALPLITAGFYSKDLILWYSFSAENGNLWLWIAAIAGAFITSLYTFRMVFLVFYGEVKSLPAQLPGKLITIPLVILAVLSLIGGFIEFSQPFGHVHLFSHLLNKTLPAVELIRDANWEPLFQVISGLISLSGIYFAYLIYLKKVPFAEKLYQRQIAGFFFKGWEFDRLYDVLFIKPYLWLSEVNKNDFMDYFNQSLALITLFFNRSLSLTQNGKLRFYIMALTIGIAAILTYMIYQ
jgi:NADH-quinone oxidoreductase subunit L